MIVMIKTIFLGKLRKKNVMKLKA